MRMRFAKMHGIGNDFVVVDCRSTALGLSVAQIRHLADRHFGIGFDQLLTIERATRGDCAFAYGIRNADGSPSGQCGNGLRCVARWLERVGLLGVGITQLQSPSGVVAVELLADGRVAADMGVPDFSPRAIGLDLSEPEDPYAIDVVGHAVALGAVSMGNPHALLEVADLGQAPVAVLGPQIEHAAAFLHGCNVGFAQLRARDAIGLRVWERGVGETLACGSGASAAVAILRRRGKLDAQVRVQLPGGELEIHWQGEGQPLRMIGPAAFVFEGEVDVDRLGDA